MVALRFVYFPVKSFLLCNFHVYCPSAETSYTDAPDAMTGVAVKKATAAANAFSLKVTQRVCSTFTVIEVPMGMFSEPAIDVFSTFAVTEEYP